jgi:alkanesulfonate monooxygenase SsuD/methylene tetrahydromethanopterin reductase-like flavin-dependent oxidoreductase (luciferase family)
LLDEGADYIEVTRRLWDSWEDEAEIRDAATGRFADRDKLHYIDFSGEYFSVRGPSITPRPPQGQPVVAVLGHAPGVYRLIARSADVGFVTPRDAGDVTALVEEIRAAEAAVGRDSAGPDAAPVRLFADLVVLLGASDALAFDRKSRLDERAGAPYESDAAVFTGTPEGLADLLVDWHRAGLSGFRLRPGVIPDDLVAITRLLVPELRRRGVFRDRYEAATLRGLLGLPRPANRYASTTPSATGVPA